MPFFELQHVSVRFGGLTAVDDVNLTINRSEIVGLIGPNGAGKTTIFNCISGIQRPQRGEIVFNGHEITRMPVHLRSRLGVGRTFQTVRLFPQLTVRQNLLLGCHAHMRTGVWSDGLRLPRSRRAQRSALERVEGLIELLELGEVADRFAAELPLGLQRLTEIGRALATEPKLLLLDEATSGVGKGETRDLVELLRRIRRTFGVSLLVVEHDVALVLSLCTWIYVLDFGRVLTSGRPEEIRRDPAVIQAYLGTSGSAERRLSPGHEEVQVAARS